MRAMAVATLLCSAIAGLASAQTLASRVTAQNGMVQVIYPSRPFACGDGSGAIGDVFGRSTTQHVMLSMRGWKRVCVHGPARAVATVNGGQITELRGYVGPVPANGIRTIDATASDAAAWLSDVLLRGAEGPANGAIVPLVLADGTDPWPTLLRTARDDNRSRAVRKTALLWLSFGVNERLGIADATGE